MFQSSLFAMSLTVICVSLCPQFGYSSEAESSEINPYTLAHIDPFNEISDQGEKETYFEKCISNDQTKEGLGLGKDMQNSEEAKDQLIVVTNKDTDEFLCFTRITDPEIYDNNVKEKKWEPVHPDADTNAQNQGILDNESLTYLNNRYSLVSVRNVGGRVIRAEKAEQKTTISLEFLAGILLVKDKWIDLKPTPYSIGTIDVSYENDKNPANLVETEFKIEQIIVAPKDVLYFHFATNLPNWLFTGEWRDQEATNYIYKDLVTILKPYFEKVVVKEQRFKKLIDEYLQEMPLDLTAR